MGQNPPAMFTRSRCVFPALRQGCDLLNWSLCCPYLSHFFNVGAETGPKWTAGASFHSNNDVVLWPEERSHDPHVQASEGLAPFFKEEGKNHGCLTPRAAWEWCVILRCRIMKAQKPITQYSAVAFCCRMHWDFTWQISGKKIVFH